MIADKKRQPKPALPPALSKRAEIERKILAGMISHGAEAIPHVMRYVEDEEFIAHPANSKIYRAVVILYTKKAPVNSLTVSDEMVRADDYGGDVDMLYVNQISGDFFPISNLDYYCNLLVDEIITKQVIARVDAFQMDLREQRGEVPDLMGKFQVDLSAIYERYTIARTEHISKAQTSLLEKLSQIQRGIEFMRGRFYFEDIDRKTGGFDDTDLIIIAGTEKSGKTTLALQIALANARAGRAVQIFSLEMSKEQLLLRAAIITAKILWTDALSRNLSVERWGLFRKAIADISQLPIYVNDNTCDIATIRAETETNQKVNDVKLVVVDYIQIVKPDTDADTREREVALISGGLKMMARDLKIPVIALTQLNKELVSRESRAIQQDMDKMLTIKREETFDPGKIVDDIAEVEMRLLQRMGPSGGFGSIKLGYDITTGSFVNLNDHDIPPQTTLGIF